MLQNAERKWHLWWEYLLKKKSSRIWNAFNLLISGEGIQLSIFLCSLSQIVTMKIMYWEDNLPSAWLINSLNTTVIPMGGGQGRRKGVLLALFQMWKLKLRIYISCPSNPATHERVRFSNQLANIYPCSSTLLYAGNKREW